MAGNAEPGVGAFRRAAAIILVVLAAVLVPLATVSVWVANTTFDTDGFTDAVDGVISDPVVIDRVATQVADEVFEAFGPPVMDRVPILFKPVVRLMSSSLHARVQGVAVDILSSDAGHAVMLDSVQVAHAGVLRVLRGQGLFPGEVVDTEQGLVTIDLVPLAGLVLDQLRQEGAFDEPTPIADTARTAATIATALGFQLQDDFGQFVVYDASDLSIGATVSRAQDTLVTLERIQTVLIIAAVAAVLGAVLAAPVRTRTIGRIGAGVALVSLLFIALTRHVAGDVGSSLASPAGRRFAEQLTSTLSSSLQATLFTVVLIALTTCAVGWSAGALRAIGRRHAPAALLLGAAASLLIIILLGFSWVSLTLAAALLVLVGVGVAQGSVTPAAVVEEDE